MYEFICGFITGVSVCAIVYPIAYHRGWLAGYARYKRISRGGE